ncbi:MAG: L-seryl-tRNA(Sec) selenium transferase [Janthinobacterium lividum]
MAVPAQDERADLQAGLLRALPPVQRLLESDAAAALVASTSRQAVTDALRQVLDRSRAAIRDGALPPSPDAILLAAARQLRREAQPSLRRTINATGILLHTNLGRAPLAEQAVDAVADAARAYCNLEFDLEQGRRGERAAGLADLLRTVSGAEAGLCVNNCAAAVLLALSALAGAPGPDGAPGEVIVSRGELVEIGGGFRIPDVIQQGGARLVEVGTTNRTRLSDYANAIGPNTRMLLRVHQSNYRIVGFTGAPAPAEIAALAHEHGLLMMDDLGSGSLHDLRPYRCPAEPTVREAVAAGADVVAFSGDKLLGGPQSGLLVGREASIARMRRHPLLRAVRADKMCLAALEATLRLHVQAPLELPVMRMLAQTEDALQARAERLCALLPDSVLWRVEPTEAQVGGGSLPGARLASRAVGLACEAMGADALALALRRNHPAVVGRIAADLVLLDMIAVADDELEEVADAVAQACGAA